jgi:hypothetical protein
MSASDLLYHAATKLHQLGVLELIPREEVMQYLGKLQPHLLTLCPPEQRRGLEENFQHLERSTGISGGKVEVLHKKGSGGPGGYGGASQGGYAGPAGYPGGGVGQMPGGGPGQVAADPLAMQRLNLLLDQLQRSTAAAASGQTAAAMGNSNAVLAHVVGEVAAQAGSSKELETQLGYLQNLGVDNLGQGLFQLLSRGLPDWAPPPHSEVADKEPPAGATRAMRKVVNLSKDPKEVLERFTELVSVAIEEFNVGSLGRAVTMLDLAERMIVQKEVDAAIASSVIEKCYPNLSPEQLKTTADDADKRSLLRRVMKFFPKLRTGELLEELKTNEDRERRLEILKLLRAHADEAREAAVEALEASVNGSDPQPWHVERNLVYLMRAIPVSHEGDIEREIDLLIQTSDLTKAMPLVRESITSLIQLDHPRAHTTLDARVSELEDVLMGHSTISFDIKEIRWLLSNAIKLLAQSATESARSIVVTHGLKDEPQLGDTYARLVALGDFDLSDTPDQLHRLLEALQAELPRRFLGVSVKNPRKSQILEYLISAVSGTNTPEVHSALSDIIKKFPDQPFAKPAEKALANMGRPVAPKKEPSTNDAVTLSGDLKLFGLPNVLQNLSDTRVTGAIKIFDKGGTQSAEIRLASGNLISASVGKLVNDIAIYQLLQRPVEGRFVFVNEEGSDDNQPPPQSSMSMMSLLLEGMRRYDEFNRALSLVADEARFKASGKKPTDVKEDADPKLAKAVWGQAARGVPAVVCEAELGLDSYRVRRLYEHWVTEGSLVSVDAAPPA